MSLKIAIVVHGRFHAFDLARELIRQGVEVVLLTNYPKRITQKFGLPDSRVVNCPGQGVASRILHRLSPTTTQHLFEPSLHRWFGRWAANALTPMNPDAIHSFTGISEEILRRFPRGRPLRSIVRGSAHIRAQARLLAEEQRRCGCQIAHPGKWMVARETREYELSDLVFVLSSFAAKSFLDEGFPKERLRVLALGSDVSRFRPPKEVVKERCRRILAAGPLRVLTVGSFTYQKGMYDLARVAENLSGRFKFRFVGDCPAETRRLRQQCLGKIEFVPRQPQFDLACQYQHGDIFVFPTIQDGYAAVLAQAQAAALPILTTTNSAGPDILREGGTGWVLPIRDPKALMDRLIWCHTHRLELSEMVCDMFVKFQPRDWAQVAQDIQSIYLQEFEFQRRTRLNGIRS